MLVPDGETTMLTAPPSRKLQERTMAAIDKTKKAKDLRSDSILSGKHGPACLKPPDQCKLPETQYSE